MIVFAGILAFIVALVLGIFVVESYRQSPSRMRKAGSGSSDAEVFRMRSRMRRMARSTMLLIPTKSPGFSKIGGLPELPPGQPWPEGDPHRVNPVARKLPSNPV